MNDERTVPQIWSDICRFWTFLPKGMEAKNAKSGHKSAAKEQRRKSEKCWQANVLDRLRAGAVLKAAAAVWDATPAGKYPARYLDDVIRGSKVADDASWKPEPKPEPVEFVPVPVDVGPPDRIRLAFEEVWPTWTRSPKFAEMMDTAASAWRTVVTEENVEDVVSACRYFQAAIASGDEAIPLTLKFFLMGRKDQEEQMWHDNLVRARNAVDPATTAAFEAAYAAFPDFGDKEAARGPSAEAYYRVIPEARRLDHLIAVEAYARNRAGQDSEYNLKFVSFTKSWQRRAPELPREFDGPAVALNAVLADAGTRLDDDLGDFLERCITYFVVDHDQTVVEAMESCVGKLQKAGHAGGLDAAKLAARAAETAHVSACKRLGFVIESRLDAPRLGVTDAPPAAVGVG